MIKILIAWFIVSIVAVSAWILTAEFCRRMPSDVPKP